MQIRSQEEAGRAPKPRSFNSAGLAIGVLVGLVFWFVVVPVPIHGQVVGATLSGTTLDTSGAVVPNVKISIKSVATGVVRDTSADSAGFYTAPNLEPGAYEVTASASGFTTEVHSGITLRVGAQQVLNITLQVGTITQQVEVTTAAPVVELASSSLSNEVDATTVRELPLNGRDWTTLATLQPGVTNLGSLQASTNASTSIGRGIRGLGNQVSISGQRQQQNNYRVDGITLNDYINGPPGDVFGVAMGVDAIQEFSVVSSNYSAEYGRTSGGVINAVTRSGTNQLHGDAYEFLRNSALDARNYFDGAKIPEFRRNQFGASAGAPIRKDKTFIFGDYEGFRQNLGVTRVLTVPSPAARSGHLCSIPTGVTPNCTPTTITVDPNIAKTLGLWPLPNAALLGNGDTGKFGYATPQIGSENYVLTRLDHHFSESDSIFVTYQWDKSTSTLADALDTLLIGQLGAYQHVAVEESHSFSASLVNNVRFGFNRVNDHPGTGLSAINPIAADPSLAVIPGASAPTLGPGSGVTTFGSGLHSQFVSVNIWNSFQAYDDAFLTRGKHSLKFGFAAERDQFNGTLGLQVGGNYNFASLTNFLLNKPRTFFATLPGTISPRHLRQSVFGAYVQDDIRWRPNLTVNLGLRYEMSSDIAETDNKLESLPFLTATSFHLGTPLFNNPTLRDFQPRIGFAWDPFGTGKTSVRAGFGIFDVLPLIYQTWVTNTAVLPFTEQAQTTSLPQGAYPNNTLPLLASGGQARVGYFQNNPPRDYVMQWNLSVQREIAPGTTVMLAYLGAREPHALFRGDDGNMVQPIVNSPPIYLWPKSGGTVINPAFGREDVTTWTGESRNNALEAEVIKHLSHGIQIQGSYTFGKIIDSGSEGNLSDDYANAITNLFLFEPLFNRALSDISVKNNLVINGIWIAPEPKFGNRAANWVLGGWEVGGIFNARNGLPFSVVMGGDPLGAQSITPYDYPNRLSGPGCQSAVNPGKVNYVNVSCFGLPLATAAIAAQCQPFTAANVPAGTCANLQGNAGRNAFIGPGLVNFDFSLFKNNYIGSSERFNAQFRSEFFNVLNRTNFQPPLDNHTIFDQTGAPIGSAGLIDATSTTSRQIQFALKLIW